ncbi:unnamed protein product [Spirodela intermedia]|uniref:CBS domain-containing protein n=1 Tax=Spirodela intermedia TaxID=51605 RepID=A0A7I8J2S3_SPIIN|nr:unnamed protein product [Spirodela intermedia]CAA6663701.1 unnamed protein product [Spirodela intermedia]
MVAQKVSSGSILFGHPVLRTGRGRHSRVFTSVSPLPTPDLLRPVGLLSLRFFDSSAATSGAKLEETGFESTTIADILKAKGKGADGSWLWCTTEDTVYEAVKSMTQNNVGALVVVKPGEVKSLAGIITERDYLRKIIVQGRSSKSTKVGDIMTEENKLITVTPDTKVLQAMQLMTEAYLGISRWSTASGMAGMVVRRRRPSRGERAQGGLSRLNAYIPGGY